MALTDTNNVSIATLDISSYETRNFDEFTAFFESVIDEEYLDGLYAKDKYWDFTVRNFAVQQRLLNKVRIEKKLYNELYTLDRDWTWLVITEAWCADSAYNLPILYAASLSSDRIDFLTVRRDLYPELIERFHTNGSQAVPKMLCIDSQSGRVLGSWGPRPAHIQEYAMESRNDPGISGQERLATLQRMYAKDKSSSIQSELIELVKKWKAHNG